MARGRFNKSKLKDKGDFVMTPEHSARAEAAIRQADCEFVEARVNFRWGQKQVELVKKAAQAIGVPYQTYIKQVVYRQALEDLRMIRENTGNNLAN
ncbi:MAG TPA: hypothetical protein PKC98_10295 [Candidatus Melainabacteria bacterium]|nr:hypothetical protein [Candidatus Melainabacteria bacterium]